MTYSLIQGLQKKKKSFFQFKQIKLWIVFEFDTLNYCKMCVRVLSCVDDTNSTGIKKNLIYIKKTVSIKSTKSNPVVEILKRTSFSR